MKDSHLMQFVKFFTAALIIIFSIKLISRLLGNLELILGAVLVSMGVLSIIWTLLARYNLSPKSQLRIFTSNFLACSIAILIFTVVITIKEFVLVKHLLYIEYSLIFITYFFLILASYYIYAIGKEFGFQHEARKIGFHLKKIKEEKPKKTIRLKP